MVRFRWQPVPGAEQGRRDPPAAGAWRPPSQQLSRPEQGFRLPKLLTDQLAPQSTPTLFTPVKPSGLLMRANGQSKIRSFLWTNATEARPSQGDQPLRQLPERVRPCRSGPRAWFKPAPSAAAQLQGCGRGKASRSCVLWLEHGSSGSPLSQSMPSQARNLRAAACPLPGAAQLNQGPPGAPRSSMEKRAVGRRECHRPAAAAVISKQREVCRPWNGQRNRPSGHCRLDPLPRIQRQRRQARGHGAQPRRPERGRGLWRLEPGRASRPAAQGQQVRQAAAAFRVVAASQPAPISAPGVARCGAIGPGWTVTRPLSSLPIFCSSKATSGFLHRTFLEPCVNRLPTVKQFYLTSWEGWQQGTQTEGPQLYLGQTSGLKLVSM